MKIDIVRLVMPFLPFLQNIFNLTLAVVIALGIRDGIKKLVLSRFDEQIEKRSFGIKEKRDAKDALSNIIAWGEACDFTKFPAFNEIAHIMKIKNKISSFDKQFATKIDNLLTYWQIYSEFIVKGNNSPDIRAKYLKELESLKNCNYTGAQATGNGPPAKTAASAASME